jgi:hypothetical protein
MLMKYCKDHTILSMAYLDPTMVTEALVKKKPKETSNYIFLPGTLEQAIHIPDTFKYIFNYTIDRYYFSLSFL